MKVFVLCILILKATLFSWKFDYNIEKLSKVGLHRISFGVEHGNEEFRAKILDRRWKNKDIIEKLKIPHKYGVAFSVNNITGFPTETKKLAFDTIELNRHIEADNANIYSFVPFHGTPLRKMCEELGLIKPETITKCLTKMFNQLSKHIKHFSKLIQHGA